MSLATRCPACHTAFRVVQDQLKVSNGWVRCGQCHEVFNALEALFELPAQTQPPAHRSPPFQAPPSSAAPPAGQASPAPNPAKAPAPASAPPIVATPKPATPTPAAPVPPAPVPQPPARATLNEPGPASVASSSTNTDKPPLPSKPTASAQTARRELPNGIAPAPLQELPDQITAPDAPAAVDWPDIVASRWPELSPPPVKVDFDFPAPQQVEPSLFAESDPAGMDSAAFEAEMEAMQPDESEQIFAPGGQREAGATQQLRFLRQAEQKARWRQPGVQALLGTMVGALAALQLAQWAWVQRDWLAARWPALAPALAAACEPLHCKLQSPALIDQIVLDSSHLAATRTPGVLQLTADLRNKAALPARMPALELSISSDTGQTLARRVLTVTNPQQSPALERLEPDSTQTVTFWLAVGHLQVAGYTVELFYP